jgi:hypothetical protein
VKKEPTVCMKAECPSVLMFCVTMMFRVLFREGSKVVFASLMMP